MATLSFSFAGESIQSAKLESKIRKFDLEFDNAAYAELKHKPVFSVESFFSIDRYAENLSEAFHMAAQEAGVTVSRLALHITGNLDSAGERAHTGGGSVFNKIDVALLIVSDASYDLLEEVLLLARELNPVDADMAGNAQFRYSLSAIHLN